MDPGMKSTFKIKLDNGNDFFEIRRYKWELIGLLFMK
jgi:hypothetical protein